MFQETQNTQDASFQLFETAYVFEAAVVSFIVTVFVVYTFLTLKERHRDVSQFNLLFGAAVYGFITGLVIAFVILPMRVLIMNSDVKPHIAAVGGIFVFLTMFSLRQGAVGRLPFIGEPLRGYRRAQLRKTIEVAERQLLKSK
ncbi:MAG: hypothetical protein AAF720_13095 [Pseudomonadota bacterium]